MDYKLPITHPDARARHQMLSQLARRWAAMGHGDAAAETSPGRHEPASLEGPDDDGRGPRGGT